MRQATATTGGLSGWSQIGYLDIPGDSGGYIQFRYLGKWQQRCQIICYTFPQPTSRPDGLGIVGSLFEDKGRLVRLLEGPFVVLDQIRHLQS